MTDHSSLLTQSRNLYINEYFAKFRFFKVDNFVLPLILAPKLRSVAKIEGKKTLLFFLLWFKSKQGREEKKIGNK